MISHNVVFAVLLNTQNKLFCSADTVVYSLIVTVMSNLLTRPQSSSQNAMRDEYRERERKAPRALLALCRVLYEDDHGRARVSSEIEMKLTSVEALHVAQNRNKWRGIVVALCP